MSSACAHLHVHSEYSLLDGAANIRALAERAAALDQPALGLTDHGVMNGAVEHYQACRTAGIKPIIGCEVYTVDDHAAPPMRGVKRNHLTLLAATGAGYGNLVRLSSLGFLHGLQGGKPTLDLAQLAAHGDGIIALTGCLASRSSQLLMEDRYDEARSFVDSLAQAFGPEDVYFEIQHNGLPQQEQVNAGIERMAREMGGTLVATGDVHYLRKEDYEAHHALLCVQTGSCVMPQAQRTMFSTNAYYLASSQEMAQSFAATPGAVPATLEIAERCNVELELGGQLIPRFLPEGEDERAYLRERVFEGLRARYGDPVLAVAVERAEYELGVIDRMGFNAYFLIVWDFVRWAGENGISVGPGRGSAAGSIIAFALSITDLDPLAHDLLFERFLNPERVSMPDIDIDFSVRGRKRVMEYVVGKYGRESVAQIITFGRMFPRAATRDAARVLGYDYGTGDRLAKLIPDPEQGRPPSFEDCLRDGQPLRAAYDDPSDPSTRKIVDVARGLEGIARNSSIHAAAVVIAGMPLTDVVPLQLADSGEKDERGNRIYHQVTQFSMKPVEQLGLLKMDFLGLRNLDVIDDTLDLIERSTGVRPDMSALPMDDAKTYGMLARGDSVGVFQFESDGMREAMRKVGPTEFADLVALNALYRPGAMDQIPTYARGKRNPDLVEIADERLAPIIGPTYGVILYQEQAMQIAKDLAGFTGAQADDLRKAIGKKNRAGMAQLEPLFREGCARNGVAGSVVDWLWTTNEKSADYSFNKSHAACYGLISYRTAWLKANHPAEYMAALISSVMDTKDKVPFYVARCEEMGIGILPPDVNESDHAFVVTGGDIRFGLDAVKGVGYAAVEAIKGARADGAFSSLWDFCERVDPRAVNKRAIEALIKSGAFGSTGDSRKGMLEVLEVAQAAGQKAQQDAEIGQSSIFDLAPADDAAQSAAAPGLSRSYPPVPAAEFEQHELLAQEKESIGLFLSMHPLKEVREALHAKVDRPLSELGGVPDGEWVTVGGIITQARRIKSRAGNTMMFATLDDLEGQTELLFFGNTLEEYEHVATVDAIVVIRGQLSNDDRGLTVKVRSCQHFKPSAKEVASAREAAAAAAIAAAEPATLTLTLDAERLPIGIIDELRHVFGNHAGESDVVLAVSTSSGHRTLRLGPDFKVAETPSLRAELARILGPGALGSAQTAAAVQVTP